MTKEKKTKENNTELVKTIRQLEKMTKKMVKLLDSEKTSFAYDMLCGCPFFVNNEKDISILIKTINKFSDFFHDQNMKMKIISENNSEITIEQLYLLCSDCLTNQSTEKLILRPSKYDEKLILYLERNAVAEIFGE